MKIRLEKSALNNFQSLRLAKIKNIRGGFWGEKLLISGFPIQILLPKSKEERAEGISAVSFIIFWDFSMFYQIFLLPQVKRWAIITYKHGIYELPHELSNDLRQRILGN